MYFFRPIFIEFLVVHRSLPLFSFVSGVGSPELPFRNRQFIKARLSRAGTFAGDQVKLHIVVRSAFGR